LQSHCPFARQGVVRGRKAKLALSGRPVKKASEVLRGLLVLRDLLAHPALRARKVLAGRQVLPRPLFELYASTAPVKHAEGSATRMRYL
jgi:hypothetical protein